MPLRAIDGVARDSMNVFDPETLRRLIVKRTAGTLSKFFILAALALLTLVASPVLGTGSAPAWQGDPDSTHPAGLAMSGVGLAAPDPTIGDTDTTALRVGRDARGIADSLTNPPADPA